VGQGIFIIEASRSHSDTRHSVVLLCTSDQPDWQTSTWQHTTLTRAEIHDTMGFKITVPAGERPQTHALDRAVSRTGCYCTVISTYIHTYVHTYIQAYMHAYIHTYIHKHARTHACMHACIHTYIHTYNALYPKYRQIGNRMWPKITPNKRRAVL
jgi:hypothetical protein